MKLKVRKIRQTGMGFNNFTKLLPSQLIRIKGGENEGDDTNETPPILIKPGKI